MDAPSAPDLPSERLRDWYARGEYCAFGAHRVFFRRGGNWDDPKLPDPALPGLVLVHGFPTSSFDWLPIWDALSRHFRLLAPDLLGFGFSSKPRPYEYSIVEQADVVETLMAQEVSGPWHLLGHDYGDSVVQELLARQREGRARAGSDQLRSVTLLNGGLFPEAHRPRMVQRLLLSPLGKLLAPLLNRQRFGASFSAVFSRAHRPTSAELDEFWSIICHANGHLLAPLLLRYIPERRRHRERWLRALTESRVPIRLINGLADPVSGAHMVRRYRQLVPHPDVVELPGIGHYPQTEAPAAVVTAVLAFIGRIDAAAR